MTIYIDEVFLVNFIMDFILLWAVGRLGKLAYSKKRLFFGALCGALYAVAIFLPFGQWIAGIAGKIGCSIIMVKVAYKTNHLLGFAKAVTYLYLVAFIMGGSVIGAMYFWGTPFIETWNGIAMVMIDFQLLWLMFGILAAIILALWIRKPLQRDMSCGPWLVQVTVVLNGQQIDIQALMDTGNQLSDPIGHHPVILVEYQKMKHLLPEAVCLQFEKQRWPNIEDLLAAIENTPLAYRIRIIPYHSVGQDHGILMGIKPDWITIQDGQKTYQGNGVVVAIHNGQLSPYSTYQGLAHPDLLCI